MRIFANANYNFIKWRWHALILSVVDHLGRRGHDFLKGGVPLGIEFTGGTQSILQFDQPTGEDVVRKAVDKVSKKPSSSSSAGPNSARSSCGCRNKGRSRGALEDDAKRVEDALRAANVGFVPGARQRTSSGR